MKKLIVLLMLLTVLAVSPVAIASYIYIDDGESHIFDDDTYKDDYVYLDYTITRDPGTHVDLVDGGLVRQIKAKRNSTVTSVGGSVGRFYANDNVTITMSGGTVNYLSARDDSAIFFSGGSVGGSPGDNLSAHNNASITMTGGSVKDHLIAYGDSTITMSGGAVGLHFSASDNTSVTLAGGSVGSLIVYNNAIATMTGGSVGKSIHASENATVTLSGGLVMGDLLTNSDGTIYLDGTDFAFNGTPLVNGDKLSDFGVLVEYRYNGNIYDYYTGTITGTLADGSAINNEFKIYNTGEFEGTADIIIIPEPCSLVLVGLGGLGVLVLRGRGRV